jgi:hypothetical protein
MVPDRAGGAGGRPADKLQQQRHKLQHQRHNPVHIFRASAI